MSEEKKKRIQVYIYPSLYAKLKSKLALKEQTITDWVIEKAEEETKS